LCCKKSFGEFGNLIRVCPSFWCKQDFLLFRALIAVMVSLSVSLVAYKLLTSTIQLLGAAATRAGRRLSSINRSISDTGTSFEVWLFEDENRNLQSETHPIFEMLKGVERERIRQCPICEKIYWAGRTDQPACGKRCNNVRRSRDQRRKSQDER
jgi:hypothetical protein